MPYKLLISEIQKRVHFDPKEFEMFAERLKKVKLKKKEVWEKEGKISEIMGFVNKGMLRQFYMKEGNEYTDCFYAEGEFIGNYISYQSKEASRTITIALEPCEIFEIPFRVVEELCEVIPNAKQFSEMIGKEKLFELSKRSSSLLMAIERKTRFASAGPTLFDCSIFGHSS